MSFSMAIRMGVLLAAMACSRATTPAPTTQPAEAPAEAAAPETPTGMTKADRPDPLPKPLGVDQLNVGTARALVVLAVSPGRDEEDAGFRIAVTQFENLRMPVHVFWLGCQPKAVEAVGQSGERWAATLSFATRDDADAFVLGKGLTPLAIVEDEVEACGD